MRTAHELLLDSYRLAVKVYESGFRPAFIVGLWRGGSAVGIAVQECLEYLGVETDHISVRTSYAGIHSYEEMVRDQDRINVHGTQYLLEALGSDDPLLIVDDAYSSGSSVAAVVRRLRDKMKRNFPREFRVAVPWYRPTPRTLRPPDVYLHQTSDWLVFPYELTGMSLDEIREHKPVLREVLEELKDIPEASRLFER